MYVDSKCTLYPIGRPVSVIITLCPIGRPVRATITLYPILHCIPFVYKLLMYVSFTVLYS